MESSRNNKPFKFKNIKKRRLNEEGRKFALRQALEQKKDKQRLRRIVKLRRIHLQRYISVKYNGTRWWQRTLHSYYDSLTEEEVLACKQNTTSDIMLQFDQILGPSKSYVDLFIFPHHPQLYQKDTFRILFRGEVTTTKDYFLQLMTYRIRRTTSDNDDCILVESNTYKCITGFFSNNYRFKCHIQLSYHGYSHLTCQLAILPQKLQQIHTQNLRLWDGVVKRFRQSQQYYNHLQEIYSQIEDLQNQLKCKDRMLFMKRGFADKTEDELEQALQELQLQQKKLLFTRRIKPQSHLASYNDCKICFFPEVRGLNEIVSCNACRSSYHLHCYGIQYTDNPALYICDSCLFMEKNDWEYDEVQLRPLCQICYSQRELPLKQIDDHFYHVTCLFFYNLSDPKSFKIVLKSKRFFQEIQKEATKNNGRKCAYCLQECMSYGIRFKCCIFMCEVQMHPLCAYLGGCTFDIMRNEQLQILIKCQYHTYGNQQDDEIRQVFIRRFFCNYKSIQLLNEEQFKPKYYQEKRQIKRQISKQNYEEQDQDQQGYPTKRLKQQTQQKYNEIQQQKIKIQSPFNLQKLSTTLQENISTYLSGSSFIQIIISSDDE